MWNRILILLAAVELAAFSMLVNLLTLSAQQSQTLGTARGWLVGLCFVVIVGGLAAIVGEFIKAWRHRGVAELERLLLTGKALERDSLNHLEVHPAYLRAYREMYHDYDAWRKSVKEAMEKCDVDTTRFEGEGFVFPDVDEDELAYNMLSSFQFKIHCQVEELKSTIERLKSGDTASLARVPR
jgi:hypothetical protein